MKVINCMKRNICPNCKKVFPRSKLIFLRWHVICPHCNSKLIFSTKVSILTIAVGGIGLLTAVIIMGIENFFSMPFIIYFFIPFFIVIRILMISFAEFEKLPDKTGLLPMTKSSKYAYIVIFVIAIILILAFFIYYRYFFLN